MYVRERERVRAREREKDNCILQMVIMNELLLL